MGYGQHLAVQSELLHELAHGVGDLAADAGIHFIEDQRGRCPQLTGGDGNGQGNAGQFAARGHLGDGAGRAAGVACNEEIDGVRAMACRLRSRGDIDDEAPALHAELLHGLRDGLAKLQSSLLAQLREARGFVLVGAARRLFGLLQGFQIFGRIQFLQLLLPAAPGGRQVLGLHAEAPCQ